MVKVPTPTAPSSSVKPPTPSVMAAMGEGLAGSVRSMIWTPSSEPAATAA